MKTTVFLILSLCVGLIQAHSAADFINSAARYRNLNIPRVGQTFCPVDHGDVVTVEQTGNSVYHLKKVLSDGRTLYLFNYPVYRLQSQKPVLHGRLRDGDKIIEMHRSIIPEKFVSDHIVTYAQKSLTEYKLAESGTRLDYELLVEQLVFSADGKQLEYKKYYSNQRGDFFLSRHCKFERI